MHPNDGRVVSNFIMSALRGEEIVVYGNGGQTRSFCYVDDLIDAMVRMMATGPDETGPINIGSPSEITIRELAEAVITLTNSKSRLVYRSAPPDDPRRRRPDIRRAERVLGWCPTTSLQQGLKKTIAYFEDMLERDALPGMIGAGEALL